MLNRHLAARSTYTIIAIGAALVLVSALVTHFTAGYRLDVGVLAVGLTPYAMVAIASVVVSGWKLLLPALMLLVDILMRLNGVVFSDTAYASNSLFSVPILLGCVILPLAFFVAGYLEPRKSTPDA
ncbi:MAG: hypothetical protein ACFCUG_02110 [Thiotrichales bacterium]